MTPLTAPIFDVQRFSIHDGPGIRTLVFFKGCNLRCAWCQNPESQEVAPLVCFYESRCAKCFRCATVCMEGAIAGEGYRVDHDRCNFCLACTLACPHGALRPIGEYLTPEQLFERLARDRPYYESSGGGVTFSGGEPALYPEFMDRVLTLCRDRKIHAALETCGMFSYKRCAPVFAKLQLIYFDLKLIDDARHKKLTGQSNARILENARRLVADGYPVEFRLTLVPGITDRNDNLEAIVRFLKELKREGLHLLGYHNMGEAKIDIIRGQQEKLGLESYTHDHLLDVMKWFEQRGIASLCEA
jgi:pyruvate formate lyase activating enzyme